MLHAFFRMMANVPFFLKKIVVVFDYTFQTKIPCSNDVNKYCSKCSVKTCWRFTQNLLLRWNLVLFRSILLQTFLCIPLLNTQRKII